MSKKRNRALVVLDGQIELARQVAGVAAAEKLTAEKSLEALLEVRKRVEAAYARGKVEVKKGTIGRRVQIGRFTVTEGKAPEVEAGAAIEASPS